MSSPKNAILWNKILQFELDEPHVEYPFSIRLAKENEWPQRFTEDAIIEYKKFMYLAAVQDEMVSPSPMVDIVWHLHLIYTESYQSFCALIGKQIQHIPATHQPGESQVFKESRERTAKHYQDHFGNRPDAFWKHQHIYDSLGIETSKTTPMRVFMIGLLCTLVLSVPAYFLLLPIYTHIDGSLFLFFFILMAIGVLLILEVLNRIALRSFISALNRDTFFSTLTPSELIYCKTDNIRKVIHGHISQLIDSGILHLQKNNILRPLTDENPTDRESAAIVSTIRDKDDSDFWIVVNTIAKKPVFDNTQQSMDRLIAYLNRSKYFIRLYIVNVVMLSLIFMVGVTRLAAGIIREKPTLNLALSMAILMAVYGFYLFWTTNIQQRISIPRFYKRAVVTPTMRYENWNWSYFMVGVSLLNADVRSHTDSGGFFSNSGSGSDGDSGGGDGGCGGCGD